MSLPYKLPLFANIQRFMHYIALCVAIAYAWTQKVRERATHLMRQRLMVYLSRTFQTFYSHFIGITYTFYFRKRSDPIFFARIASLIPFSDNTGIELMLSQWAY